MPAKPKSVNRWSAVLKEFRERMGWLQDRAAAEIDASVRSWKRWESVKAEDEPTGPNAYALRCMISKYQPSLLKKLPE